MQVAEHVEGAESLLKLHKVDEAAATAAVAHAKGEIAIGRLSMWKAKQGVDRTEEEER